MDLKVKEVGLHMALDGSSSIKMFLNFLELYALKRNILILYIKSSFISSSLKRKHFHGPLWWQKNAPSEDVHVFIPGTCVRLHGKGESGLQTECRFHVT